MTTKDDSLFLNNQQQFFENINFNNGQNSQQYSNLNLNQTHKYSNLSSSTFNSKLNTDNKKLGIVETSTVVRSTVSDDYERKQSSHFLTNLNDKSKNQWKPKKDIKFTNSVISKNNNSSTLSLHISAYENSIIETKTAATNLDTKNERKSLTTKKERKNFYSRLFVQNPFEFPRQQNEIDISDPEIVQFKTSQKLFFPNQSSSSIQLDAFMEDCPLLTTRKKSALQISWNGNQECMQKHEKLILESLKNGEGLIWRRHEKPIETKFDIKFVQFCEDQISHADEVSFSDSIAFVHIFFVCVSSADEYRTQIRHRISEWFGMLNKAGNSQWLIIFDSTKAKEKKNRGSVMEKIKSDFSKHQEKLIEISDTVPASTTDLSSKFLSCFLSSLDKFLANYERSYAQLKGNWESDDWSISGFVNQQFNLCRFYWNLGLYDCVLGELDKIDLLISEIIYSSTETRPTWLKSLTESGYGPACPLLRLLMHVEGVADNVSLIELRTFILANQILSLFYIFNTRTMKAAAAVTTTTLLSSSLSRSSGGDNSSSSCGGGKSMLSNDFATILLRYAYACTQKICTENSELGVKNESILSQAWQVLLTTDVLELCQYFIDLDALQNSTGYICQLLCLKCNNLDSLYHSSSTSKATLALWIKSTVGQRNADVLGRATAETLNILRRTFVDRSDLEGSPDQGRSLEQYYEDTLSESIKLLRIYAWEKAADGFMKKLFDCYRESGDTNEAKILYMKLLKRIFDDCRVLSLLLYYCKLGVNEYENELKSDRELWINVLLVLVLGSETKEDREKYGKIMLHEAEMEQEKLNKYNFAFGCPLKFPLQILKISENFISTLLTSTVKITVTLNNNFDFLLPNCQIKAIFKKLSKTAIEPLNPSFVASLSSTDAQSRCACPTIGLLGKESNPNAILETSISIIEDDSVFFTAINNSTKNSISLKPGKNEIIFEGIAFPVGCFVLNHFEIEIAKSLIFLLHYQQEISQIATLDNVFLSVDVRKPVVKAGNLPDKLIAGIAQKIVLEVTAGTTSVMKSNPLKVSFEGDSNLMEFRDSNGKWTKSISMNVPDLQPYDTESLEIFLCLSLDQMHYSAEDSLIMRRQIKVEWLDQIWLIDLSFTPIMSLKMSTTIIEQRVLFSVDIKRSDSLDFLDLCLQTAELLQHQSIAKPPVSAKLINSKLQNISAHSLHRIVWELPPSKVDKSIPIKHLLTLKYSFEKRHDCKMSLKETEEIIPECAIGKGYSFEWKQELPISKAEYDICAQIIADNISLCRVDSECSLLVSLRRMSNHIDSRVIAIIDADSDYWTVNDKIAVVPVKESGVGQTSFTIIPRQIGLLPYPSVYIHQCNPDFNEKDSSITDTTALGERLSSYHRLQARQFRVVAARQATEDSVSQGNASTGSMSIRQALKERSFQRLKKLIDRD